MNTKSTAAQFHRTSLTLGGVLVRTIFIVGLPVSAKGGR